MTREQVKQELKELKNIRILIQKGFRVDDNKGLEKKYDKVMENLNSEERIIFLHHIYLNEPYYKIGMILKYSEEGIRKKYSKIIDKLANMLEIKQTNFDKITESVESLAEIMDNYRWCPYFSNSTCDSEIECKECIIEWLQQEYE